MTPWIWLKLWPWLKTSKGFVWIMDHNPVLLNLFWSFFIIILGGGTLAWVAQPAPPAPHPPSQSAFKFKRFGVQFHKKICSCGSFFFSVADFFFSDEVFYRYRLFYFDLTFWKKGDERSFKAGVLNLLVPAYPQISFIPLSTPKSELYALRVPPNQMFYPKGLLLSIFLNFAYPLCPSRVPLGVRVPQVENRCFRAIWVWVRIEPRSSCTWAVCATDAPLHIH